MKLASLLAQYLHEHHRLDLPGIGTFQYIPGTDAEEENKRYKQHPAGSVSFESNPAIKDNPELTSFISSKSGKIKALAAADLGSHLELAKQFLNIGKPFLFEGIGSLVKIKAGEYGLAPAATYADKPKEHSVKEYSTSTEETGGYSGLLMPKKEKMNWRKPALILLILAGIGLAVWGGYTVYKITTARNKDNSKVVTNEGQLNEQNNAPVHTADTGRTVQNNIVAATVPAGQFKFVIENADSARAFQRYYKLKGFGLDIKMETADSTRFKLFFLLPASAADTARMADSLQGIYTPKGQNVIIENKKAPEGGL